MISDGLYSPLWCDPVALKHTHTCWFLWFTGTLHRRNGFYTVQTVCAIALHLNLALTGDGAFLLSPQKTHSVWFISILNYLDTENVLINHLLLVIPMSYPCYYTNLCPHKPHKHAHTHTHTHTTNELLYTVQNSAFEQSIANNSTNNKTYLQSLIQKHQIVIANSETDPFF